MANESTLTVKEEKRKKDKKKSKDESPLLPEMKPEPKESKTDKKKEKSKNKSSSSLDPPATLTSSKSRDGSPDVRLLIPDEPKFEIEDVVQWMLRENPADFLDVRDNQLVHAVMLGKERQILNDIVNGFLKGEGIYADERDRWGPPKFQYSEKDEYNCFDYHARNGCLNCGCEFDLDSPFSFSFDPPVLKCQACGKVACPLHFDTESESLADILSPSYMKDFSRPSGTDDKSKSPTVPGCVYLRGSRAVHDFGQNSKEWWQSYYLPSRVRNQELVNALRVSMLAEGTGELIFDVCEVCQHTEARVHSFQARSADEGMTNLYECTKCHNRRVLNT